ncbi:AEC family transporter [Corynebacterium minutissimum]|uniref:ABC transporter permease n=1 Tax=Corynebacterium minutissimum TaxID=38301 RepID=A0A2X4REV4_9CORY|nr:AEC family transporter [Corynebacterium minutissimum]KHO29759.1 permease [Corynebacterium minutissimum]MCG7229337.1 AEC family transporter [Corynebacterium minutissimum]MCG7238327.1 AEC family transporter [Corynebacterium minutissimum]QPS60742.1 AEC family transporter [Corynebacterium minutissimum]QQA78471.1 AEC family transporter [Corynebacterium minutissimum]
MLDVLTGFAIIFVVIAVGFVLAHKGVIGKGEARLQFNRVAFWAATPALIFSSVAQSDTSAFASPVVAVIAVASVATMGVYGLLSMFFFRRSGAETMAGAAASSYYNSVNIGLPIATYVIGDATFVVPALVLQMAVLSPFIIAGLNAQGTNLRSVISSMMSGVTAPVVIAAVLGFIVSAVGWTVPDVIMAPLEILGGASIPMILMSFGASLKGDSLLDNDRLPTIVATALKLIGMPAIALAAGVAFGLSGNELYAALILAALPTAQNVYNYAATYQVGETVARDTVFLTTFLSLPAMLGIAALFG